MFALKRALVEIISLKSKSRGIDVDVVLVRSKVAQIETVLDIAEKWVAIEKVCRIKRTEKRGKSMPAAAAGVVDLAADAGGDSGSSSSSEEDDDSWVSWEPNCS